MQNLIIGLLLFIWDFLETKKKGFYQTLNIDVLRSIREFGEFIFVLFKTFEFTLSKDKGFQDSRLVVHILQLEWSHGLRLHYLEIDICALECIEDVRELAGEVFFAGRLQCFHKILSHHR